MFTALSPSQSRIFFDASGTCAFDFGPVRDHDQDQGTKVRRNVIVAGSAPARLEGLGGKKIAVDQSTGVVAQKVAHHVAVFGQGAKLVGGSPDCDVAQVGLL